MTKRDIHVIAHEIASDWKKPNYGAVPYLDAMFSLSSINDSFGYDTARGVVAYFLCNAGSWRGDTAKRIKKELKSL
jgi:hypothetical protein